MSISGKVIIVTGGNGLIGKAITNDLAEQNAIVINVEVNVTEDPEKGLYNCNITDATSVTSLIQRVNQEYGRIDGLVSCAYPRTADWQNKFEDVTLASWRENVDMQLNSCFFICQKVLEIMKGQGSGSIVNIASIYGVVGNDFSIYEGSDITAPAAYSAIKGGIINFTRYLASYYGPHNIRVNTVSPGGIFNNQDATFTNKYKNKVPLKRMGVPEDIAPAVRFLLSDDASYITGHNLIVDGGWTAV